MGGGLGGSNGGYEVPSRFSSRALGDIAIEALLVIEIEFGMWNAKFGGLYTV